VLIFVIVEQWTCMRSADKYAPQLWRLTLSVIEQFNDLYTNGQPDTVITAKMFTITIPVLAIPYITGHLLMASVHTSFLMWKLIATVHKWLEGKMKLSVDELNTLSFVTMKSAWNCGKLHTVTSCVCRICHTALSRYAVSSFSSYCWTRKRGFSGCLSIVHLQTVMWIHVHEILFQCTLIYCTSSSASWPKSNELGWACQFACIVEYATESCKPRMPTSLLLVLQSILLSYPAWSLVDPIWSVSQSVILLNLIEL